MSATPSSARRKAGSYGLLSLLDGKSGNSHTASPERDARMPACGREGGGGVVAEHLAVMARTWRRSARERHLTRGTMDGLRKADDGLSSGILFSSTVGVATQQVVLCLDWCASTGQPESTPSNARTRPVTSSTGKRSAVKVACCVWTGGKDVSPYLSVLRVKLYQKRDLRDRILHVSWAYL